MSPVANRRASATDAAALRSLSAAPELWPAIEFLTADLEDLGVTAAAAFAFLRPLRLAEGATALELGCGRGALAVKLAEELKLDVTGIDAHAPYVEAARTRAESHGVADRCRFRCEDPRETLARPATYDVALMIGRGDLLGDQAAVVGALRRAVREGGRIVVDDGYLATEGVTAPGYEGHADRDGTARRLTLHGDTVLMRWDWPPETTRRDNRQNAALIGGRVAEAKERWPDLAAAIDTFVQRQEAETAALGDVVRCALWVLRRGA